MNLGVPIKKHGLTHPRTVNSERPDARPTAEQPARAPITVLSRFTVANGTHEAVKTAFQRRPHLVEDAAGFLRMEVISPLDQPAEIWLLTFWEDRESYETWHRSHLYKDSHRGIPPGLKLVPGETSLTLFEHVSS